MRDLKGHTLVVASHNAGKLREFAELLAPFPVEPVSAAALGLPEPDETGTTYAENAALKARAYAAAGDCWALADDSGIEIDALGGRPGVYSARYGTPGLDDAGRTNLLLAELDGTPDGERGARYRAVVAVSSPAGDVHCFEGTQEGTIGRAWRGERGFGYDPVFITGDGRRTNAELTDEEKDAISHRGKAMRAAAAFLREVSA